MRSFFAGALCAVFLGLTGQAPLDAQTFQQSISTTGWGDPLASAKCFGIAHEPVSDRIFVAVSGDFITPNRAVVIIDPASDTIVGEIPTGSFPQDVAFAYDAQGNLLYGAVTNSNDGSVTVWDANDRVVATVALPDPLGFGTCYPYGITAAHGKFWVSTVDGSGDVHAVDVATLSYDAASSYDVGAAAAGGRLRAVGDDLWNPTGHFSPAGGGLHRHDVTGTVGDRSYLLESATAFPAAQEVLPLADGRALLGGTDFGGRLYLLDAAGELARTLCVGNDAQGLAVDAAGELAAACDLVAEEVALVDLLAEEVESVIDVGAHGQLPNDAVFAHGKLYVSCQGSETVLVYGSLPSASAGAGHAGTLSVSDTTPAPGDAISVRLDGFPAQPVALLSSPDCQGATVNGVELRIGPGWTLRATGSGSLTLSATVPAGSWISGRRVHLQGWVPDGAADHTTLPLTVVVQ